MSTLFFVITTIKKGFNPFHQEYKQLKTLSRYYVIYNFSQFKLFFFFLQTFVMYTMEWKGGGKMSNIPITFPPTFQVAFLEWKLFWLILSCVTKYRKDRWHFIVQWCTSNAYQWIDSAFANCMCVGIDFFTIQSWIAYVFLTLHSNKTHCEHKIQMDQKR